MIWEQLHRWPIGTTMSSSFSLSLHPDESSHLQLGWWIYYHPSTIPIFGRGRSAGVMETITILNPQNSHEVVLGSQEKFLSASSLPLKVNSVQWDQNPFPFPVKGELRNWERKAHLGCATKKCYQIKWFFSFKETVAWQIQIPKNIIICGLRVTNGSFFLCW